jgi:hypothetical protein
MANGCLLEQRGCRPVLLSDMLTEVWDVIKLLNALDWKIITWSVLLAFV